MVKCSKAEVRRLKTALRWKLPAVQRQRIQMVLLREGGMTQPAIAEAMGASLSTVNRAHMAYDRGGLDWLLARYWKRMGQYGRVFTSDDGALLRNYEQRGILRGR